MYYVDITLTPIGVSENLSHVEESEDTAAGGKDASGGGMASSAADGGLASSRDAAGLASSTVASMVLSTSVVVTLSTQQRSLRDAPQPW